LLITDFGIEDDLGLKAVYGAASEIGECVMGCSICNQTASGDFMNSAELK
jgi:hypothetical protein